MADVRCQFCGKSNPAEAEVCRYCHARLKPLRPASPGGTPPANAKPGEPSSSGGTSEGGDWLSSLRASAPKKGDEKAPEQSKNGGNESDWLSRIREKARGDTGGSSDLFSSDQSDENTGTADWLQGLSGSDSSSEAPSGGEEDWFARLNNQAETPPSAPSTPAPGTPSSAAPADDLSGWLGALSEDSSAAPTQPPAAQDDWAANLRGLSFDDSATSPETPAQQASTPEESDTTG